MRVKKIHLFVLIMLIVAGLVFGACAQTSSTPASTATTTVTKTSTTTTATTSTATTTMTTTTTATPAGGPKYGGTLTWIRNTGIPQVGAPADVPTQTNTMLLVSPVLENLVTCDDAEHVVPWLAESFDIAPDGSSITLHLRKGVKFQDGTDFNAQAVIANWDADLKANCAASNVLQNVTKYDTPDPYTLVVNLKKYDASFLLTMAETGIGMIASPTALAKPTTPDTAGKDHCIGTGPFKFDSWEKDQYIRFVRWDGYWQKGKPYVNTIEIRNNADVTVSLMSFKAREVNMVENIDPSDYVELNKEGYHVAIPPLAFVFSIAPDSANPDSPFANPLVRQALDYAIDKEGMAKGIGLGTQFPAYQCASSADGWYIKDYQPRKYDPQKAKDLLKQAGYANGFTYPLLTDVRARMDQVLAIQNYLKAVGIDTTLDKADVPRMTDWQANGWKGLMIPGFPNWSSFMSWANRFSGSNLTFPSMAVPDGWANTWVAIKAETNEAKRMQMMQDALKKLYDGAYLTPYIFDGPRYVTDGTIQDMQWDSHHINGFFSAPDVWIK